ncbi:protein N-terminal glutamine amidohydrolase isoform X4 [Cucumis sativus]|uniref:protein N-terminal glutamine amidohydrolase isoform X4 n=1 Tax=Cucumis sativus TaxID=3659 RepID=UPI0012F4B589|nr:protein N-terminal glutamine amidohydrolase isoform X4 [Cucumis sativus]
MFIFYARNYVQTDWLMQRELIFLLFSFLMRRSRHVCCFSGILAISEDKFPFGIRKPAKGQMVLFCGITMSFAFSYVSQAIRPSFQISPEYQRLFRIIHAPILFRHFASDRRHMKDSNGNWMAKPPDYEAIVAEDGTMHNLYEYMEIKTGDVYSNKTIDVKDAVFSQKLGAVANNLEEFFTQIL